MTNPLFLTAGELRDLTGYQKPGKQIGWLRTQGFTFRIAADGYPRVDRRHYSKLMGAADAHTSHRKTEPNFNSLRVVGGRA